MARRTRNTETAQQTETNDMTDVQFQDETQTFRTESEEIPAETEGATDPSADQAEAEDGAEGTTRTPREPAYHFNPGDTAMIVRGKYRQQSGTILKYSEAKKTYAVELDDEEIVVVNATNLKPPADSGVSQRALAEKLAELAQDPEMASLTARLAIALDEIAPEFSVKYNEATAS